jgi:hypothetical protein
MEPHLLLSDEDFAAQFAQCKLDPELFSHEAHLRLAWIHIRQKGLAQALELVPLQIQRYVDHLGAAEKYDHPLTIAAIKMVAHFLSLSDSPDFPDFLMEFPELKNDFANLVRKWM